MRTQRAFLVGFGVAAMAGVAPGQVLPGTIRIDLKPVAAGLVAPVTGVPSPDGTGRLFVVDQTGRILIFQNGAMRSAPFLDLSGVISPLNAGYDEKGLLGVAFHPQYAQNGRFFVRYSKQRVGTVGEPCFGTSRGCHEEILAEYHVSGADPNIADPGSEMILFRVNKPQFNHNAGDVTFGTDGFLYFTLGDGGGANDGLADSPPSHGPIGNGQNITVPLGKMLRIDVDHRAPYTIPATNPFAAGGGLAEIWAWGFRNPYRFSFDSRPGGDNRMWLPDVGQDLTEEVNIGQIGLNYGWVIMEGPHCFDPFHPTVPPATCNMTGLTLPIASYNHNDGIAVVGGFVYRGSGFPALTGKYVFGDFSLSFASPTGRLFYIDPAVSMSDIREFVIGSPPRALGLFLKGFAQDAAGEIYALAGGNLGPTGTSAMMLKIVPCYANCDDSTAAPILNVGDFGCFLNQFASGNPAANCDLSTTPPMLNISDFTCFLNRFAAGCG
jgi:glucose/arabinose dehydrogenase